MAKVIDISELISLVCDKLIEYGVQPHTVWSDYSYNYRPILHFSRNMAVPIMTKGCCCSTDRNSRNVTKGKICYGRTT